ncbi:unnamed protein product [Larinioides sclopetarius]|uniref:VWFC domain-containing protein n=2 Tax=Larinioides sclopetarius TaxID=280406 RepID=A0AAV2AIB2_9ARAC
MECRGLWGAWPLVLLFLCSTASAHYLREPKNETISSQGTCFYNGTWFQEKEELPTRGLCLICHCFPGFVEPNAFTCSVIDCPWEDYHRRFPGCTPIYADRDCCPIGWECDYGTQNPGQQLSKGSNCDCEWRYLKHYEAKGCRPVYEEKPQTTDKPSCTCPWRFDCSQADEIQPNDKVCVYKKHVYPVGSKIPTTNPCETCTCATDYFTQAASISCTTTECPAVYSQTPLPEGCHYVYKEDQCCPTSVECPTAQKDNMYQVPACEYKGKMFYEGEQIYPDEDPCLICLCNQNWTGINSSSCRQHDCMLERDARKLKQGCIPIYHEKTCCPIDYHCADDDFDFKPNRGASFKSDDDEDEMCFFESRYYPIGHVLDIKHPTNCVTCTCKTPPDFTCIHSSCPPPPNNDYTNCKAVYKPHSCCPDYTCEEKTIDSENTKKEEELNEEKEKDTLQQLIQECKNMQCASDERCMLVQQNCDKEPCLPVPKCEKVSFGCGQSTCPEGCVEIGSYENNCPLCFCKEQIKESPYKLTCRVQSCEENCILTGRDEGGCPICKCPQGNLEERACASSPCRGFNCTMAVNSLGCAECRCQLSCKPKECPAGCDLDLDVPENSGLECGCQCKNSTTAVEYIHSKPIPESCSDISCNGLNCTVGEDKSGCPYCNCKAPCPTPVCQEGCQVEKTTEPGRCPGCVCKLSRSIRDNKAKECPPPTCLGYNCSVITEENGCQKCLCESPCEEEPQCPAHCKLETNVPEGRCRGCVCSFGEQADANNKPQRGGGKVPDGEENEGEPEKREDLEADFIPLPGKDLVPGVDKLFLIHGDNDQDQFDGIPGYHYNGGHAYPVFGEPLESGLYNVDDHIPGEFESSLPDEAREEVDDATSENRNEDVDYGHDEGFDPEYAEEKAMNDEDDEKCKKKNCPEGQKCVIRRLQCIRTPCPTIPVCIDVEPRCPIPMCAIGCMVMKWDDEVCPSCFCGIIRGAEGRVCPRTRCMGRRCYNVIGDDGCPQCKCDSICIPPKCYDGCFIEKDPPPGKCPTCTCPDRESVVQPIIPVSPTAEAYSVSKYPNKTPLSPIPSYQCPTPHCNGYNCSLIRGSDGCQKCVCDSPCAPCPQHCVKTKTLSEGRCPICDCTAAPPAALSSPSRHCPPVDCSGNNCRTVRDNDGCMTCICDPKCVEPQCDPGCEILRDVPPGQCPGCVCRVTVVQAVVPRPRPCSPVTCGKNCKETRGPDGCPQCVCHPECPPLKCDPGCSVQNDVAAGQCPTCVCSNNYADDDDDEDDDLYCPNLFCSEYGCREVPGPAGCPICMCDPVCKTPVCDPGCQVVSDKYHGRCPVCLCSNPINGTSASEPIKTEEGIKTAPVQQVVQQEQQVPVTFSGIIEAVVAEEEVTESTLHTTVTVELDTEPYTEETTTEATTTTTESPTCPAPVCSGLRCNMEVGDDGCEVCKCKYKCPKPKCVGNCYAETNAPSHRCPGCVCPSRSKPPKY